MALLRQHVQGVGSGPVCIKVGRARSACHPEHGELGAYLPEGGSGLGAGLASQHASGCLCCRWLQAARACARQLSSCMFQGWRYSAALCVACQIVLPPVQSHLPPDVSMAPVQNAPASEGLVPSVTLASLLDTTE